MTNIRDTRECPDCGTIQHISNMWPECGYCRDVADRDRIGYDVATVMLAGSPNEFTVPEKPFEPPPLHDVFDHKQFPVPLEYAQRAARAWCRPLTKNYEMQPAICYLVARLIYHLECAETELFDINSNRGTRLEIGASIRPILNALL